MRLCLILGVVDILGPSHGFMLSPSNYQTRPSHWKLNDATIPDDSMASTEFSLDNNEKGSGMVNGATMSTDSFSQGSNDYQELKNSDNSSINVDTALIKLLQLAATTGRGEFATKEQREEEAMTYIEILESNNPTLQPALSPILQGTWELVFSNTQLFRSSPFFMAGRAVCQTMDQAKQYDWFCDMHRKALAISTIGDVRHVISSDRLVSEFEVQAGAVPFLRDLTPFSYSGGLPITIDGAICSSADITPTADGMGWEIYMDTVEIKGSNLPGIQQLFNTGAIKLKSRDLAQALEDVSSQLPFDYKTPRPIVTTTYLSPTLRIIRDQDGKVFVYTKVSERTEPKDYSSVMPDLGIGKLLEGINDTFIKYYI